MGNYKVGDKVRIINKRGLSWNSDGLMDKWQGKVMTIRRIDNDGSIQMIEDVNENGGGWSWLEKDIAEKINSQSIHITANGNTVHAVLKDGGKVIKRSKAVCAPSDMFDFETGARIAFDRLCTSLAENSKFSKPQTEDKPKYYSGKVVCVKANKGYWGERLTVGKVYEIIDGVFAYGDGAYSTAIYTDVPNNKERFAHAEFIEFKPDKPAEPINLYCVKSCKPGIWLTKGKTYTIEKDGAEITYDDGWKTRLKLDRDCLDGIKIVPNYLVPEAKRPAKMGEWIKITHSEEERAVEGKIYQFIEEIDGDAFIKHPDGTRNPDGAANIRNSKYVVLDGYKPEADNLTIDIKEAFAEIDKAIKADKCTSCCRERINEAICTPKLDTKGIYAEMERILKMAGI